MIRMYEPDHALVISTFNELDKMRADLFKDRDEIIVGLVGKEIIFEEGPLLTAGSRLKSFCSLIKAFGIQKIRFNHHVTLNELRQFVKILSTPPVRLQQQNKQFKDIFEEQVFQGIRLEHFGHVSKTTLPPKVDQLSTDPVVKDGYEKGVKFLTQTIRDLKGSPSLNVHSARQIVDGLLNNIVKNKNLLPMLTSMRTHDEEMFEHGVNVSVFTLLQAEVLGIGEKHLVDVGMAALLHDVGNMSEVEESKEGKFGVGLSYMDEINQRDKDVKGAKILLESDDISPLAAIVAFEHTMRYDMEGLPRKLYGKELNLISMMIAISDYYDKLRKTPDFYEAGGPERAYEEMTSLSGTYFQPDLLKNFFSVVGIYPPGTLVELDTGETGLVIQGNLMDIHRPQVEILYDAEGKKYESPSVVNLIERDRRAQYKRSIVQSISVTEHFDEQPAGKS